jgi:hypothetical protein
VSQVLVLCAELGMVRLGVVAFDGVKIAANAAKDANRGEAALRRLAQQHLAAAAAADTAEDALFGAGMRGDELPRTLHDRTRRGERIGQALAQIADRKAATAGQSAGQAAVAEAYQQAVSAGKAPRGAVPNAVDPVAVAKARWERERATAQARLTAWQAKADAAAAAAAAAARTPAAAGRPAPPGTPHPRRLRQGHGRVSRYRAGNCRARQHQP